jgi:ATP-dependent protease Clp ATPase subunit
MNDCSFCGQADSTAKKIIHGSNVYICDRCVSSAAVVIFENCEREGWSFDNRVELSYCSFCGKKNIEVETLIQKNKNLICIECVKICLHVLINDNILTEKQKATFSQFINKQDSLKDKSIKQSLLTKLGLGKISIIKPHIHKD